MPSSQSVPGAPAPKAPDLKEPVKPRQPLPPKDDQRQPEVRTVAGAEEKVKGNGRGQRGEYLTTATGTRLYETDHSLTAGERGPTLLQDHHLREKITHFDHERIPERVVHARGAAAHGTFLANGAAENICKASLFASGARTPVFVRFSTVLGSRGSADTVRDTRGFATKFYTDEGVFDLVGNNIPVFFIQDGIKFPDIIHAAKPHPDREIPQAQSAHDTFWDFVSLHTEATAHTLWNMSDRGIPRSYRMMEGFGIHTFRLVNADGETNLVKFHWKPAAGVHSLVWDEAQIAGGVDPDFHRRDLADAIEAGAYPSWDLGVQVFPDTADEMFEGIDLLDPTKIVPEELAPVQVIGTMTLDANPTNFFAETEQVAFHPGHLVPGVDITNDRLLQARLFSYLDTQITRLGGPNFDQIPINRPHSPVNDMLRDGFHQDGVHTGVAPYHPNSLDGGCPFLASADSAAYIEVPEEVSGRKVRQAPASFDDHFSQARLFYRSLSPVEQEHVAQAYTFELGKCYEENIKIRNLGILANIDAGLVSIVAGGLGLPVPEPTEPLSDPELSPALSQVGEEWPVDGRIIALLVDENSDLETVVAVRDKIFDAGMVPLILGPHGGTIGDGDDAVTVQRTYLTARSIEFDAILLSGDVSRIGEGKLDPRVETLLNEMYRHSKAIGGWGESMSALAAAGIDESALGVVVDADAEGALASLAQLLKTHRVWGRFEVPPTS